MSTKTEAERRLAAYNVWAAKNNVVLYADATRALFSAIFDPLPLPPEPEPVKSLGQIAWDEIPGRGRWCALREEVKADWERSILAAIAAHEARRPKPTVDEVAQALSDHSDGRMNWPRLARAIFPLFGVTP